MPDNFNMAILGHVDSGKTTLAKALSSFASTAAFDKSPQSQQRGITLDLGFSYFTLSPSKASGELRVTLVDCPGHSSLLKTVMGGLRIVDGAVVVIDVAKGVQAQTAECLALAEIIAAKNLARGAIKNNIFVAVNKIDMLESEDRSKRCNYVAKFLNDKVLKSRSLKTSCVVYVSALNREVEPLIRCLEENIDLGCLRVGNSLRNSCSLILAYEHCFGVKGKGAIITGTVIEGILVANQKVYVPVLDVERKIKSIQMFGQDVKCAKKGDRIGICVPDINPSNLERGYLCYPKSLCTRITSLVLKLTPIRFYQKSFASLKKVHVNALPYYYNKSKKSTKNPESDENEGIYMKSVGKKDRKDVFVVLKFDKEVLLVQPMQTTLIVADLNLSSIKDSSSLFRLMYYGKPLFVSTKTDPDVFDKLILKKELQKKGVIERFYKENYVTCKNLFGLKTAFNLFVGMHVWFESNGEGLEKIQGVIEKPFGSFNKTGKFIVSVKDCDETFIKEKLGPGTNVVIDYKKVLFGRKRGDISQ